ncbi:MAG: PKD domain-containing protein [Thermoplasmata archaeon]|nr:PKD domain-containing protein [Thermoplasmata archaeon]
MPGPTVTVVTAPTLNASLPMWRSAGSSGAPPARADAATAFDLSGNVAVVFGGYFTGGSCPVFSTCALGDTWEFADGAWSNLTPSHPTATNTPSPRWGAAMSYDPAVGGLLLFGGTGATSDGLNDPGLNDTWEFVRGAWSPVCGTGCPTPVDRWDGSLTYSLEAGEPIMFGGESTVSGTLVDLNDTWAFNPTGNWTELAPSVSPSARYAAGFAYDHQLGGAVLFGGIPSNSETWLFRNAGWHPLSPATVSGKPSARGGVGLASDPLNGSVTLFGGCAALPCNGADAGDTWVLAGTNWYNLTGKIGTAPSPRDQSGFVASGPRGALLLFAGEASGQRNDTWMLAHIEISAVTATPAELDVGTTTMLTVNVSGGFGPETLTWIGLPSGCASANVSVLPCVDNGTMADQATVVVSAVDPVGEAVESPPSVIQFNPRPTVTFVATPLSGIAPLRTSFEASPAGGTGAVALAWEFGDQGQATGPDPAHNFSTSGSFTVTVWANDSDGVSGTARTVVTVLPRLTANATFTDGSIVVGHSSVLLVQLVGGVAPFAIHPLGALPNCTAGSSGSSTEATYTCTPNASGNYQVVVHVSDNSGQARNVSANLTVLSAPIVPPTSTSVPLSPADELGATLFVSLVVALVVGYLLFGRRNQPSVVPPAAPEGPIPTGNLYVPPDDSGR